MIGQMQILFMTLFLGNNILNIFYIKYFVVFSTIRRLTILE
jgi:hypothetical protein